MLAYALEEGFGGAETDELSNKNSTYPHEDAQ